MANKGENRVTFDDTAMEKEESIDDKRKAQLKRKISLPWMSEQGKGNICKNCYGLMLILHLLFLVASVVMTAFVWYKHYYGLLSDRPTLTASILCILFVEIELLVWLLLLYCYKLERHTHNQVRRAATMNFQKKIIEKNILIRTIFQDMEYERSVGMFYFSEILPEPYTKKYKGTWNTIWIFVFRFIWFSQDLAVIIFHAFKGHAIKLYFISQQSNWLCCLMNLVGLVHVFIPNKRKSYLTNIYGMLYLVTIGNVFLVGLIVIPDNLIILCSGRAVDDFGYDDIIEHFLNPIFIFQPFIWEYVDIKVLWTPWPLCYGLFYVIINFFYVMFNRKSVYGDLWFDNEVSVVVSLVICVVYWIPTLIAYFISVKQKSKIQERGFGEYRDMSLENQHAKIEELISKGEGML